MPPENGQCCFGEPKLKLKVHASMLYLQPELKPTKILTVHLKKKQLKFQISL